jgi:hypothetical protein
MNTTINAEQLKGMDTCQAGYNVFFEAHQNNTVKFSEALTSNGFDDLLWLLWEVELNEIQQKDLRLLACVYAEEVLHLFENEHTNDKGPREANKVAKVASEYYSAMTASAASGNIVDVVDNVSWLARVTLGLASCELKQTDQLMSVLLKWES